MAIAGISTAQALEISIPLANASFESPPVDTNDFPALPLVTDWSEIDLDTAYSTNTGVFANTPAGMPGHIVNADGNQLAFMGSALGNALEQDLAVPYRVGCAYQLTVGVAVSAMFPPAMTEPADALDLVFYYRDGDQRIDIATHTTPALGFSSAQLQNVTVHLRTVDPMHPWAGQPMGIALRANGQAGGFWDLDLVRVLEILPVSLAIENPSFELPTLDPNGATILPTVDGWREIDLGMMSTGVWLNTLPRSNASDIVNVHENQLAFFNSESGTALEQDLSVSYEANRVYRLTVAVGISKDFPPSPADSATLSLALYWLDGENPVDIAVETIGVEGMSSSELKDISVYLPPVDVNDPWVDQPIGIAMRGHGIGGFWNLDHVRLDASLPNGGHGLSAWE
jgi:hypothetical protein